MEALFRTLKANEIECRINTIGPNGVSLLLYKDARVDMKLLDELGPMNWKRSHQLIGDRLFCTVEIWDENKGQWISKQDLGTASYSEKEKGEASDSFKRCCFSWGVGRELYSAPQIFVSSKNCEIKNKGDNKYFCAEKFSVSSIEYNSEREIIGLSIVNENGREVFRYNAKKKDTNIVKGITDQQVEELDKELERTGVTMEEVSHRYEVGNRKNDISPETYKRIMIALKKTKSAA